MRQIKKAIIAIDFPAPELDEMVRLMDAEEIVRCASTETEVIEEALKTAEIAILGRPVKHCEQLMGPDMKWLHCDAAGLDFLYTPELAKRADVVVTCSSGRSSKALSEHVLMFMLALNYRVNEIREARKTCTWSMPFLQSAKALVGQTIGILGVGSIARELAPRCKALEMRTIGYAKTSKRVEGIDELYYNEEGLLEVIRQSDFLVSALPLTDETYHLLNEDRLSQMKPSAYLVNISRGAVIDESAMIDCLKRGGIAGAGLDTFEQEPLGADSPLWNMDNVIMTPHVTPPQPDKHEVSLNVILNNITAYREERELGNQYKPYYSFSGKK